MNNRNAASYGRAVATQQISASTTTAKATNAVGSQTYLIWVFNRNTAGVAFFYTGVTGDAATAANGFPVGFNQGAYLACRPGEYVHCLLSSGTATVDVCEITS